MSKKRSRAVDHLGFVRRTLAELAGYAALAFELIQNADDTQRATWLRFDIRDEALWVEDDGGFTDCGDQDRHPDECPHLAEHGHRCDFHSFRLLSGADKRLRDDTTGAFGIGFTAVYQITDRPEIISGTRHWTVDETAAENDRIAEDVVEPPWDGTRIILPWARNPDSEFRRKVAAAAVPDDIKDELVQELDAALAPAMLFLRNLRRIELSLDGDVVRVVTSEVGGGEVVIDDGGHIQRWRLLRGSFREEADRLRARHLNLIESTRKPDVAVAIPIGFDVDGKLCVTLPTEQPTELPIHVNAELYLASNRRHLSTGTQYHNDWNTEAIDCAARLLAGELAELPALLGPKRLWMALEAARKLTSVEQKDSVVKALTAFWKHLGPEIPNRELVWTSNGRWATVGEARFVQSTEDEDAFAILQDLGVALVHPMLRDRQNILRASRVRYLGVRDVAAALVGAGLDGCIPLSEVPEPFDDAEAREQLWSQLGRMIGRLPRDDRGAARIELGTAAVVPSMDGRLCPIAALWRTDSSSVELLSAAAHGFPFLHHEQLPEEAKPLSDLCDRLTAGDAVSQLAAQSLDVNVGAARELVGWLNRREAELEEADRETLAGLAIFPSVDDVHPLTEVALPGDFEDPLDLALLVERETAKEHAGFLERLGVRRLNFVVYARNHIPRAFDEAELTVGKRRSVVSLLAQRRGQLDDEAQSTLAAVPLVECTDGRWRNARDVYFDREVVAKVLGPWPPRSVSPPERTRAVEELLEWLGVAHEPRAADVVARVEQIARQEVDNSHRQAIERIVSWLGQHWGQLEEREQNAFTALRSSRWLPARGSTKWYVPTELNVAFRDYLYKSQGRFLDVGSQAQGRSVEFLRWLGLKREPSVGQVVAHLRHCSKTDTQPNIEVYGFLNNHAEAPVIEELLGVKCLRIDGQWRRPDEVYWSEPPFGRWRLRLGNEFTQYRALWDALGVKEAPDHRDAMMVISDISEKYTPFNQKVSDEDLGVLQECWVLCEAALQSGELSLEEIAEFGDRKVITNRRDVLAKAAHLFFEDLPDLADEFPHICSHIIRRHDGTWRAMRAAGVRDLSKVAIAQIIEIGDLSDEGEIRARIEEREEELARVIAPHTTLRWRYLVEQLDQIRLIAVTSMTVVWKLEAFNEHWSGKERSGDALWQEQEGSLYFVVDDVQPVWEAMARELVRALLPDVEPATLALNIAAALRPSTREAAKRALDAAGSPSLAPEIRADISATTATQLDAKGVEQSGLPDLEDQVNEDDSSGPEVEEDNKDDTESSGEGERGERVSGFSGNGKHKQSDVSARGEGSGRVEGADKGAANSRGPSTNQPRSRLRSYVVRGDHKDGTDQRSEIGERRDAVDKAGVEAVERFEREAGRSPEVKPHNNPGYDVLSLHKDQEIARYIEVKSSGGRWDGMGVGLSGTQFTYAQLVKDQYWLYVVEYALDDERRHIWPIPDPARRVTEFMFDDGWKDAAEFGK